LRGPYLRNLAERLVGRFGPDVIINALSCILS
jgi:hypothetical protein